MNFFAHAVMAAERSTRPRFLLGSMLPDLLGMLGMRLTRVLDAELADGVEHHHATDAAFHGSATFVRLCSESLTALSSQGLGRGTARAVAHVGIELLLDGVLGGDEAARQRFGSALAEAQSPELPNMLELTHAQDAIRLQLAATRLALAPIPLGYRDPIFVTDRLEQALARRPRLAMQPGDRPLVERWTREMAPRIAAQHADILSEVHQTLKDSSLTRSDAAAPLT